MCLLYLGDVALVDAFLLDEEWDVPGISATRNDLILVSWELLMSAAAGSTARRREIARRWARWSRCAGEKTSFASRYHSDRPAGKVDETPNAVSRKCLPRCGNSRIRLTPSGMTGRARVSTVGIIACISDYGRLVLASWREGCCAPSGQRRPDGNFKRQFILMG